jgi:hypothetical protein
MTSPPCPPLLKKERGRICENYIFSFKAKGHSLSETAFAF